MKLAGSWQARNVMFGSYADLAKGLTLGTIYTV